MNIQDYMESDTQDDLFTQNAQDKYSLPSPNLDFKHVPDQFPGNAHAKECWRTAHDSFNPELKKKLGIEDVVKELVLPFLPAKSLCRFKAVCKEWNQWINNTFLAYRQSYYFRNTSGFFYQRSNGLPVFISMNSYAYGVPSPSLSFLPEVVTVRTSCNGLICCQSCVGDSYYICNPANKQWLVLPESNLYHGPETALVLAYEPSLLSFAANYELICAIPSINEPVVQFEIFSSRSRTWRVVDTIFSDLHGSKLRGDGFYMKGFAYWETLSGDVLVFDLRYELYSVFPLPAVRGPEGVLTECHGELCYVLPYKLENDEYMIEVYGGMGMSLKHAISFHVGKFIDNEEEEGEEKRASLFHVSDDDEKEEEKHAISFHVGDDDEEEEEEECLRALPCLSDDTFAVLVGRNLVAYDVRAHKVQLLNLQCIYGGGRFVPYVNSLVPVRHHVFYSEIRGFTTHTDKVKEAS